MATDIGPGGYHTGTAAIAQGDTVVTFQNEGNLFDIVKAGDSFGTHVGQPIRIASLDRDNAQATLAYPWPGPSQTAAPYEIAFNPYIIAYRQAVRTILDLLKSGNVAALAELAGEADTMPYFTGAGQMGRTTLTSAARALNNLAGAPAVNKLPYLDAADGSALADLTAFARTLLDDADAATARSTLGLSPAATMDYEEGTWSPSLGSGPGGNYSDATGYTVLEADYVRIGSLVRVNAVVQVDGVEPSTFTENSALPIQGLPYSPAESHSPFTQGGITGAVYNSFTGGRDNAVGGGISRNGNLYCMVFYNPDGKPNNATNVDDVAITATYRK